MTKLEGERGRTCSGCGPDDWSNIEVTWDDEPDPDEPERCPECGEQLVYTVTWGDE